MTNEQILHTCKEYCTGCGLCVSIQKIDYYYDDKKFLYPNITTDHVEFCKMVCPAAGNAINKYSNGKIFGSIKSSYLGWSNNENIRFNASSGGTITAICEYLFHKRLVDGVIQVKKDPKDPRMTITVVSKNSKEIRECCGSRYTASSPMLNIINMIEKDKTYAFVGKPCDVSALSMLQKCGTERWTNQIKYMFSFFCAGQPSMAANNKLINSLGCSSIEDCQDISYRGNGWPGKATVKKKDNSTMSMDYEQSWMTILGRDVRKCCRFCADGTGEFSDISCGDAWYLKANKPDFTERPGRNVIFARTDAGMELLKKANEEGYVYLEEFDIDTGMLKYIQPYQYNRKASLESLKLAMRICGRRFPLYENSKLREYEKGFSLKNRALRFIGTIKRVWSKSI